MSECQFFAEYGTHGSMLEEGVASCCDVGAVVPCETCRTWGGFCLVAPGEVCVGCGCDPSAGVEGVAAPAVTDREAAEQRKSIRATYDSRETGPQYHVTVRVGDETIAFQQPITDPFVRETVTVGWRDALRLLWRRRAVEVVVIVGGTKDRIDDVLELDDDTLIPGSTRHQAFRSHINEKLGRL